jgi:PAS domain S-box-containing protein
MAPKSSPPGFAALTQIRLATLGVLLTVLALIGLYVWQDWRESVARAEERAMSLATVTEAYVLRRLRETESGMRVLAELRSDGRVPVDATRSIAALHRRNFPFIVALGIVDAQSKDLLDGDAPTCEALLGWASRQPARGDRLLVGQPLRIEGNPMPVIPLLLRVAAVSAGAPTLVVGAIRADFLSLMHAALKLGPGTVSVLVDDQAIVLAREPFIARAIGLDMSASYPAGQMPPGRSSAVALFASPLDGQTYIRGAIRLKDHPLYVRSGESWNIVMAPWRERAWRSLVIAVILASTIAWLGRMAAQRAGREQQAIQARISADALYRDALEMLAEGVVSHAPDGSIRTFNAAALRILGMTENQLRDRSLLDPRWRAWRADGSDFPGIEYPSMRALTSGQPQRGVLMEIEAADGRRRWVEINAIPAMVDGAVGGVVVSFSDITEQRANVAQIETLNRTLEARVAERTRRLQELASELGEVTDRERRQIARDLHDDIAQTLAAARIRLAGLADLASPQAQAIMRAVGELIDGADASTRSLAARLAPPALSELGLVAGLDWLVDEMDRVYGLAVDFADDGLPKPTSQSARSACFRTARELLINASKHSGVKRAALDCRREGDNLVLEVRDGGRGFDPALVIGDRTRGLGLRGIDERLRHIGGSLTWQAAPGAGARAIVCVPLAEAFNTVGAEQA